MDIRGRTIWQQAAGDTDRNLVDVCLKWNVILNGEGSYGRWPDCEESLRKDGVTERKITDLRRFCQDMNDGDFVVLRLGKRSIYGVGQIVGEYEWRDEFNDVDGWDMGNVRRVRWFWETEPDEHGHRQPKQFDINNLKWGDTTQLLNSPAVESWVGSLNISDAELNRTPVDLPKTGDSAEISFDNISDYLFAKGVASASILSLLDEIGEFVRIANWYNRSERPSERETVNYLVVPLLRALGWTPQRMAIEWNRIDAALFSSLPRKADFLSVVVEAKKMGSSCLSAFSQARDYAVEWKQCRRLIVTDGLRYGVFTREERKSHQKEEFSLYAYMNLTSLRNGYPIYDECKGAQDALWAMSPEWR